MRLTELDEVARSVLADAGATSPFLGYQPWFAQVPFPAVICTSVNDAALHGIPTAAGSRTATCSASTAARRSTAGSADSAISFTIGPPSRGGPAADRDRRGARSRPASRPPSPAPGSATSPRPSAPSAAPAGYGINTDFGGHGVGRTMHEGPPVPNEGRPGRGLRLGPAW